MSMETRVTGERPAVVGWYRLYCGFMVFLYVLVAGAGATLIVLGTRGVPVKDQDSTETIVMGIIYLCVAAALIVPFTIALFLPFRYWTWVYGIVMIALGMTSCCCLPATVPLLIYWIQPRTKDYFRNGPSA